MTYTIRVSLSGTDALESSPDARNYALLADEDNFLIKFDEELSGGFTQSTGGTQTITHDLGYIPYAIVFFEISSGKWRKLQADGEYEGVDTRFTLTTTTLDVENYTGSDKDYIYYIFYNQ